MPSDERSSHETGSKVLTIVFITLKSIDGLLYGSNGLVTLHDGIRDPVDAISKIRPFGKGLMVLQIGIAYQSS